MSGKEFKVFSLEDESMIQGILRGFLNRFEQDHGYTFKISMFSDPVKGLFELTSNGSQYDLIFLDVHMPTLTGDEIFESLRHVNPELLNRILFVTGFADDVTSRFPDMKLNVLNKPFQFDNFSKQVELLLQNR